MVFLSLLNFTFSISRSTLTSWRRLVWYRNQSIILHYLQCKSMDWFLYDRNLRHERVKSEKKFEIHNNIIEVSWRKKNKKQVLKKTSINFKEGMKEITKQVFWQFKYPKVWNMLKINNKDTRTTPTLF